TPSVLGNYKAETFAFANGGAVLSRTRDKSIDDATFKEVVHLISPALTCQNYIAATDPDDTDLLIFVYWGATNSYFPGSSFDGNMQSVADWSEFGNASLMDEATRRRDRGNFSNAALLGYSEALATHFDLRGMGVHGTLYEDLIGDVEEGRYFVILTAFDFKTAWQRKQLVPLWSVRYNIPTRGNHFTAALPSMSMFASRFFGRDSGGLVRRLNPTGHVDMGDVKILGAVDPVKPAEPDDAK
ncbi:MAG: hypothetical protein ABUL61_07190, partial [Oleiharenicola lentus]